MELKEIEQDKQLLIGQKINKYKIIRYISSGAYGDVYEAIDDKTNTRYALKIPIITKEKNGQNMLLEEAKIYKKLTDNQTLIIGVADVKITEYKGLKIIVMDLLGESLDQLLKKYKKFSLTTIIKLTIQFIDIIKYIHDKGYLHRDIKPSNFVIGTQPCNNLIYCIDFGLSSKYITNNKEHIKFSENKNFCGTVRYCSLASHKKTSQSRKDDLESIMYTLVYMYNGKLPWSNLKSKDKKELHQKIMKKKLECTIEELCKGLPREFTVFFEYVKMLEFHEKPLYKSFKKIFEKLLLKYPDSKFEWE